MKPISIIALLLGASIFGASQEQEQHQHQRQVVNSHNTVTNSHNNTATGGNASGQSATFNQDQQRQVPFAYSPESMPTAPCRIGRSAGGSSPYFGLALGGSSDDKECEKRVAAASFADVGNPTAAAKILCTLKAAKDAGLTLEDCLAFAQPPAPVVEASTPPPTPSIVVPAPAVTINNPVIEMPLPVEVDKPAVYPKPVHKKRPSKPCGK